MQSWPSCRRGARGAPAQLVVGQSLCIASAGRHPRGLEEWGGSGFEAFSWGERAEL